MTATTIPINEIFYSIQGEGTYTGTPMLFIRVAGCNLKCSFCDQPDSVPLPGYQLHFQKYLLEEIVAEIDFAETKHICFTGGEPALFAEEIIEIIRRAKGSIITHVESNGTINPPGFYESFNHIVIAPHINWNRDVIEKYADDIKILMDEDFEFNIKAIDAIKRHSAQIYIQPVNALGAVHPENLVRAMEFVLRHPTYRLSPQFHKFIGCR